MDNLIIGSHVGFKAGTQLLGSVKEALSYGANTFMFYTGAPQNTLRSRIDDVKTKEAMELMKENNIDINNVVVHAPYIINLANNKNMDFNISFLKEEIKRCESLGIKRLVLHPGSHVGLGVDAGIYNMIESLNYALKDDNSVVILLETMAGKGSECARTIDEMKLILDGIEKKDLVGVCLDTCHINDAGYDINKFDDYLSEFDSKIGLDKIGCIHINDSKNICGSHKDRHENIGLGTIGFDALIKVIYSNILKSIPKILETPYVDNIPPYKQEIEMIRNKKFNSDLISDIKTYK